MKPNDNYDPGTRDPRQDKAYAELLKLNGVWLSRDPGIALEFEISVTQDTIEVERIIGNDFDVSRSYCCKK